MDTKALKMAVLNHLMKKAQDEDMMEKFPHGKRPVMEMESIEVKPLHKDEAEHMLNHEEPDSMSDMNNLHDEHEEAEDKHMGEMADHDQDEYVDMDEDMHDKHGMHDESMDDDEDCSPM